MLLKFLNNEANTEIGFRIIMFFFMYVIISEVDPIKFHLASLITRIFFILLLMLLY